MSKVWLITGSTTGLGRNTDLLTAAFQMLSEAPKSVPSCDHIRPGYRRRNVERHMI